MIFNFKLLFLNFKKKFITKNEILLSPKLSEDSQTIYTKIKK